MAYKEDWKELLKKYEDKIETELGSSPPTEKPVFSKEYNEFKKESLPPHFSLYERLCKFSGNLLKMSPDSKKLPQIQNNIETCHLNVTPEGVTSFAYLFPLAFIVIGSLLGYALTGGGMFFVLISLIVGAVMIIPLNKLPAYLANQWRMKASNQMVLSIFYIVTYMRHTSNIELALNFAADHLSPPLSLDLKKVIWDVETGKFESVRDSLDSYLEKWKGYNDEYIEAMHLIESSLFEPSEERRLQLLDKSLEVILSETYEKMLHYAHNLKSPITMLHMLGVILPILGLVILPLVVSFMEGISWVHLMTFYNVLLPIAVFLVGKNILSKRPTGYGDTDASEIDPELKKLKKIRLKLGSRTLYINPLYVTLFIIGIFFIAGLTPILMHMVMHTSDDWTWDVSFGKHDLLGYKMSSAETGANAGKILGPYGLGASLLSLLIVAGIGIGVGFYFKKSSKDVMQVREKSKRLEEEFGSALFQLGNRLGDGMPTELAFGRVSETMAGTVSGNFFSLASNNIRRLGMGVEQSVFDEKVGALRSFPSNIIESSMKVLIQSSKKGPKIASNALLNIAQYIKEIHKVNERLKDLLSDIVSSMKSQINFMAPVISGIVIGITSMITTILINLGSLLSNVQEGGGNIEGAGVGGAGLLGLFGDGIPTYFFQIVVGIYVVQIIYILTVMSNGIENGADKLAEKYNLGINITKGTLTYVAIAAMIMLLFNMIASTILTKVA